MTRKEAITILYAMKADNLKLDDPYSRYRYDAVNIAIKALEQLTSYERTINKLTKAISEYEPIADRIEYGTDGNAYRLTVSNGKEFKKEPILEKIRAEIEQAADKQFQIAMGIADLNERYTHIQMENAYRHCLNVIDKYRGEA